MTTTAFAKVLRKGGFNMLNIGEPCNHNGERYPFKKDVKDTYHNEIWRKNFKNGYRIFSELEAKRHSEKISPRKRGTRLSLGVR